MSGPWKSWGDHPFIVLATLAGTLMSIAVAVLAFQDRLAASRSHGRPSIDRTVTQKGTQSATQRALAGPPIDRRSGTATSTPGGASPSSLTEDDDSVAHARLQLQRLGVQWNSENFVGAIVDGDVRSVALFLQGGMRYDLNYRGASAIIYALQPAANNRLAMMQLFLAGDDPNATLVDSRIMRSLGSLPPHFSDPRLPTAYGAWNHSFAGPMDLWLVIRASYAGLATGDAELLRQLASKGATFDLSLSFLQAYDGIWRDFPAYRAVRSEVAAIKPRAHDR